MRERMAAEKQDACKCRWESEKWETDGPREGLELAHNGVRGDNDVAVREARRGSNRITNWMRRMA